VGCPEALHGLVQLNRDRGQAVANLQDIVGFLDVIDAVSYNVTQLHDHVGHLFKTFPGRGCLIFGIHWLNPSSAWAGWSLAAAVAGRSRACTGRRGC
jgi:hypothetical protein